MPAAAIVVPLIAEVIAPSIAATITSVVGGAITAAAGAIGVDAALAGAIGTIGGAAALKGAEGAAEAAITGGDIGTGALTGALTGAVSPALKNVISPAVTSILPSQGPFAASTTLATDFNSTILGATTVADVTTGAIVGSGTAAAQAAIQGGDIVKAAEYGAVAGATAPVVSGVLNEALGGGKPTYTDPTTGTTSVAQGPPAPPSALDSTTLGGALVGGLTPLISGTLGGVAVGQRPEDAFKANLPAAAGGALSGGAMYGLNLDQPTAAAVGNTATQLINYATTQPRSVRSYTTPSGTPSAQPSLNLQGPLPSPTLGQSLSIAPTLGYTPSGSVFGSSDAEGKKSNVWNVGSLRNIGAAEA